MNPASRILLLAWLLLTLGGSEAHAFMHVVQRGDTLASVAERYYGRIQHERLLVAANVLEAQGGSPIVPGMRLEVPALAHRRIRQGDSWSRLAAELLGAAHRADVLAAANDSSPWLVPAEGSEIIVPYNLRIVTAPGDNIVTIAYEYLGDRNQAWVLDHYNGLKGRRLRRGDVVLVPLVKLELTPEGLRAARAAGGLSRSEGCRETREQQLRVRDELPALVADVKSGRYIDAIARGTRFLASSELSRPTLASVQRQLVEAYVAVGAIGLATAACSEWRKADPSAKLDPVRLSPKIIFACNRGSGAQKPE